MSVSPRSTSTPPTSATPHPSSRTVGLVLGLAAACVGIRIPELSAVGGVSAILVVVALVVALSGRSVGELARSRPAPLDIAFIFYVLLSVAIELFNASSANHEPALFAPFTLALSGVAMCAARLCVRDHDDLVPFLRGLTIPAVVVAGIAILQLLNVPGVEEALGTVVKSDGLDARLAAGWDIRATSTIGHWTALGGYLIVGTAAACLDLMKTTLAGGKRLWPVLAITAMLIGEVSTLTFATAGVAAAIVAITVLQLGVRPGIVFASVSSVAVGIALFGETISRRIDAQTEGSAYSSEALSWLPQTVAYRINIWVTETLPAIAERPITGWGWDVYRSQEEGWPDRPSSLVWGSPESEWLRTLISGGWLLLTVEVVVLLVVWWGPSRSSRLGNEATPIRVMFIGLVIISSIHSHFANGGVPLIFWPLIGAIGSSTFQQPGPVPAIVQEASRVTRVLEGS